jgi:hypothetical protein
LFTEHFRVFQSISEHFRAFQSISEHFRAFQSISEYFRDILWSSCAKLFFHLFRSVGTHILSI